MASGSQLQVAKLAQPVPEPPCWNLQAGTSRPEPPGQNLQVGTSVSEPLGWNLRTGTRARTRAKTWAKTRMEHLGAPNVLLKKRAEMSPDPDPDQNLEAPKEFLGA